MSRSMPLCMGGLGGLRSLRDLVSRLKLYVICQGMCFLYNRDLVISVPGIPTKEHTRNRIAYVFLPYS